MPKSRRKTYEDPEGLEISKEDLKETFSPRVYNLNSFCLFPILFERFA